MAEQLAAELSHKNASNVSTHNTHMDPATVFAGGLMAGLVASSANDLPLQQMSGADLARHVSNISLEQEIIRTMHLLYSQHALLLSVLTRLVLNKSFKNLRACPFDLESLDTLRCLGWSKVLDYARFNIVLLKKYHDLRKPLSIRKNLRTHFESQYWPLIETGTLSPFYERIVWKFYFELVAPRTQPHFLQRLPHTSAFLIYESSFHDHRLVATYIADKMQLSPLQRVFFDFCKSEYMENLISREMVESAGRTSPTLSLLKRCSIKHKLASIPEKVHGVSARLNVFAFIKALQAMVDSAENDPQVTEIRARLGQIRQALVKQQVDEFCDLQTDALMV